MFTCSQEDRQTDTDTVQNVLTQWVDIIIKLIHSRNAHLVRSILLLLLLLLVISVAERFVSRLVCRASNIVIIVTNISCLRLPLICCHVMRLNTSNANSPSTTTR